MSMGPGPFRSDELDGDGIGIPDAERAESLAAARELEQTLAPERIHPSAGFADRVMAAVAREPAPRLTGFLAPLRTHHGLAGVVASVRAAWTVAGGGGGRPGRARSLAFAYVLAVLLIGASLTGVAALGTAGALGLLTPDHTSQPSILTPGPTPSPDARSESAEPSESVGPSGSPDASESAEPSDSGQSESGSGPLATPVPPARGANGGAATPSPTASDDHGGATASPGSSDGSGGDSGSGSPTQSPKPSETR